MPLKRLPRRKNRTSNDENWIRQCLVNSKFGFVALANENSPHINPILFIFREPDLIYFHTKKEGYSEQVVKNNDKACFCVAEMGELVSANRAVDFTTEYKSVIAYGTIEIVTVEDEVMDVYSKYFQKYFPNIDKNSYKPFDYLDTKRATLFRLKIEEWSGKSNPSHA